MSDLLMEIDLAKVTAQDLEGEATLPVGKFHVRIVDIQRRSDPSPYLKFRYEVLAGTDPSAVGCLSSERFFLSDKAMKRLAILAYRLKLITEGDFGARASIDWACVIGKELIVQVVHEEYGKQDGGKGTSSKWGYAMFWGLDDERVSDVPRAARSQSVRGKSESPAKPKTNKDDYSDI